MLFSEDLKALAGSLPKTFLFLSPFIILFTFPLAVFLWSGENVSIHAVIRSQKSSGQTVLLGKAYTYPDPFYKLEATLERKPDILALGTSRVLEFRSKFFQNETFFNAGRAIFVIEDFKTFLDRIPVKSQPRVIIVGLDQHLFFPGNRGRTRLEAYQTQPSVWGAFLTQGWRQIYYDFWVHKFTPQDLVPSGDERVVGLTALVRHSGFRNDGSYQYGDPRMQTYEEREKIIDKAVRDVTPEHCTEYEEAIAPETLDALRAFLETARGRNITVIGFVPPYAHRLYEKMRSFPDSACAANIQKLPDALRVLFSESRFELFDFTDTASFGGSDKEMIDDVHAGEKSYLRMFVKMLKDGQALRPYANLGFLEDRLRDASGDLDVFIHEY